jgi:Putative peptidoglycan binding domain
MAERFFNQQDKGWRRSLFALRIFLVALMSGAVFVGVVLAADYAAGTFSSGTYGGGVYGTGDATPPTTPAPAVVSSGGGWSGGCSTYPQGEVPSWGVVPCTPTNPSQGAAVLPGTQSSPTPTSSPPSVQSQGSTLQNGGGITLTKNHQLWDRGEDIRILQKFFNTHGFIIAAQGPGSPGSETSIFGGKTYQALIKFQKANNLPQTGYLGPLTRAALGSSTSQ